MLHKKGVHFFWSRLLLELDLNHFMRVSIAQDAQFKHPFSDGNVAPAASRGSWPRRAGQHVPGRWCTLDSLDCANLHIIRRRLQYDPMAWTGVHQGRVEGKGYGQAKKTRNVSINSTYYLLIICGVAFSNLLHGLDLKLWEPFAPWFICFP